jgi:hypothetical protein
MGRRLRGNLLTIISDYVTGKPVATAFNLFRCQESLQRCKDILHISDETEQNLMEILARVFGL